MAGTAQPPLGDYALIGDCHSAALVSRAGSIDWCCLPRFDSSSTFGRLLDWERAGHCQIAPAGSGWEVERRYREGTLVLETTFSGGDGELRLTDCMLLDTERDAPVLLRVAEALRGTVELDIHVRPRFDYGEVRPWIQQLARDVRCATGGDDALLIQCDVELDEQPAHELRARATLEPGDRVRLALCYLAPEEVADAPFPLPVDELDARLEATVKAWRKWLAPVALDGPDGEAVRRSALVLRALTYVPTGAIVAAPTTSLPEAPGGERNWDYRYSWVRDSSFAVRSLAEVGLDEAADAFRRFIQRSAAGHAEELQVAYGVGGERRIGPQELDNLAGYRGARPVRAGNGAIGQLQLDVPGEIVNLAWRWHERGHSPDDDLWRFIRSLVDGVAERWREPDQGIWEWPGPPRQFVHSKALCWSALDRALRLADECDRRAPVKRWREARDELRRAIEREGFHKQRGVFVQSFGARQLDAALLLLPTIGFVDWEDERMARTADAIREELGADEDGCLLYRYLAKDTLPGQEGAFAACSFWLVELLARQGRRDEARTVFDRASSYANDLGLMSEEIDPQSGELLGNYPQGLTHLAQIAAAVALAGAAAPVGTDAYKAAAAGQG